MISRSLILQTWYQVLRDVLSAYSTYLFGLTYPTHSSYGSCCKIQLYLILSSSFVCQKKYHVCQSRVIHVMFSVSDSHIKWRIAKVVCHCNDQLNSDGTTYCSVVETKTKTSRFIFSSSMTHNYQVTSTKQTRDDLDARSRSRDENCRLLLWKNLSQRRRPSTWYPKKQAACLIVLPDRSWLLLRTIDVWRRARKSSSSISWRFVNLFWYFFPCHSSITSWSRSPSPRLTKVLFHLKILFQSERVLILSGETLISIFFPLTTSTLSVIFFLVKISNLISLNVCLCLSVANKSA